MRPFPTAAAPAALLVLLATPAAAQPVGAPGSLVPQTALAFGARGGAAIAVDAQHPLPATDAANAAFRSAVALTVGTPAAAGRSVLMTCATAGDVALVLGDGSALKVPVAAGLSILPFAVTTVTAAGTTAACTYANLS